MFMRIRLLAASLVALGIISPLSAEVKNYEWDDIIGMTMGISANGKYAAILDDQNNFGYLWKADDPENPVRLLTPEENSFCAYDVADDGSVVGYVDLISNTRPAIYRDGEVTFLPVASETLNTAEANKISPDGKFIAGTVFMRDANADQGGRYYPCLWERNESGEYELTTFNDIELPDHQGFIVTGMTPDAYAIGGRLYCAMGSNIPALIVNHELIIFNELETIMTPWEFRGKFYAGLDETGKQIWVEDPNDPRVELFPEYYIDGFHDGTNNEFFDGEFSSCDSSGNFFGHLTKATDIQEDGSATLTIWPCVYNVYTGEWLEVDNDVTSAYSTGLTKNLIFTANNKYILDGTAHSTSELGIESSKTVMGVNCISADGKVLGVATYEIHPAIQEPFNYPHITVLDESPIAGIDNITENESSPEIKVLGNVISVTGASKVAVFNINGQIVSESNAVSVTPGVYIVKADSKTAKVIVK